MEHTCTTCSPTWPLSANQTRSTQSGARQKKNSLYWVPRWCRCTCALPLDGFVWGSTEACILRAGGGKHFITEIRRLSEPCDSECRTCLPFTHRCRLSQSGVSGAALAALTANEVWGTARIGEDIWSQFGSENLWNEQARLKWKTEVNRFVFFILMLSLGSLPPCVHSASLRSDKGCQACPRLPVAALPSDGKMGVLVDLNLNK